jgi:hypothetical protein
VNDQQWTLEELERHFEREGTGAPDSQTDSDFAVSVETGWGQWLVSVL